MFLENLKQQVEKQLKKTPRGCLRCITNHGSLQYYIDRKYVKKSNLKSAADIAQRDYNKALLCHITNRQRVIQDFIEEFCKKNIDFSYNNLHPARKSLVCPIVPTIEEKINLFLCETYEPLPFREDDASEIFTENNERVRSKSEKMIADKLLTMGIPYRYERPLTLMVSGQKKIFRPDFTIINKTSGRLLYLEHLGMMDNPEYCTHAIKKIEIYEKNGYLLGDSLFITKETSDSPLNTKILEKYIENNFLY